MRTRIKLQSIQNYVSDANKHFQIDLGRKLRSWSKFEPNVLTWLPNSQIEKTTVYLLFSLFIKFSAIETRQVFSQKKACDKFITMTGKKGGVPMLMGKL